MSTCKGSLKAFEDPFFFNHKNAADTEEISKGASVVFYSVRLLQIFVEVKR